MQFTLEEQGKGSQNGRPTAAGESGSAVRDQERVWLTQIRDELDGYYKSVEDFATSDPADVMALISSIGARLTHLRVLLHRSGTQRATSLRTREVDPLIEAIEFQFKIHSRIIAIAEFEWKVSGGAA